METEEILVTEFQRHTSPSYNEIYKKTVPCHLQEHYWIMGCCQRKIRDESEGPF